MCEINKVYGGYWFYLKNCKKASVSICVSWQFFQKTVVLGFWLKIHPNTNFRLLSSKLPANVSLLNVLLLGTRRSGWRSCWRDVSLVQWVSRKKTTTLKTFCSRRECVNVFITRRTTFSATRMECAFYRWCICAVNFHVYWSDYRTQNYLYKWRNIARFAASPFNSFSFILSALFKNIVYIIYLRITVY